MNQDMNTQVREYTEFFQGGIEPVDMEEILHRRIGDGPVRPVGPVRSTHRRGWVTAAVAAVVTVIALGGVAWLSQSEGEVPPADETPPTTAAVTPTTEPATANPSVVDSFSDRQGPPFKSADLDRVEWTKIDLDPYVPGFAGSPNTVYRDIDGYVISGAGVLTFSSDGRSWTTDPLSPELAGHQAFGSKGEWAVAGTGEWQQQTSDTRVLLHSDGLRWNVVDLPGSEGGWPEFPIASGTSILVPQGGADQDFWVSIAGGPFEPQETPWNPPRDMVDGYLDTTILAAPDGGYIALMTVFDVHPDDRDLADDERDNSTLTVAELWTSPDGIAWQDQGLPGFLAEDAIGRSLVASVRSHLGTLVSSVYSANAERRDTGETMLGNFTSTNGLSWTPASIEPDPSAAVIDNSECWIHAMNMGYLCAGLTMEPEDEVQLWLSTDGDTWATVEPPEIDFESYGFVGGASYGGVGDLLYVSFGDTWIGHFND